MICVDCKLDLSLENFTTGKNRCKKCQYQYQKARKIFMETCLIPLKNKLEHLPPNIKLQQLLELNITNKKTYKLSLTAL